MTDYMERLYIEDEEENQDEFVIDSANKADWALEKIKEERARRDLFIQAAEQRIESLKAKIDEAKSKCDSKTSFLLIKLNDYLDTAPAKITKTQMSLELPNGKLIRKLPKIDYQKNESELLKYVVNLAPEYLKIEQKVNWAEMKKDLQVVDGMVMRKSTGEIIDCISTIEKPATFDVD